MMRDKIKLLKDFSEFSDKCRFCRRGTHLIFECSKFHYMPDKDFLIKKLNFTAAQIRTIHPFRRRERKINSMHENFRVQCACLKFNNHLDEEDDDEDAEIASFDEIEIGKFERRRKSNVKAAARALILKEKNNRFIQDENNDDGNETNHRRISFGKSLSIVTFEQEVINSLFMRLKSKLIKAEEKEVKGKEKTIIYSNTNSLINNNNNLNNNINNLNSRHGTYINNTTIANSVSSNNNSNNNANGNYYINDDGQKSPSKSVQNKPFEKDRIGKSDFMFDYHFDVGADFQWYFPKNNVREVMQLINNSRQKTLYETKRKKFKTRKNNFI